MTKEVPQTSALKPFEITNRSRETEGRQNASDGVQASGERHPFLARHHFLPCHFERSDQAFMRYMTIAAQ